MRLRSHGRDAYVGFVGACRIEITRSYRGSKREDRIIEDGWRVRVVVTRNHFATGSAQTLRQAIETATAIWLRLQLDAVWVIVRGSETADFVEFAAICKTAREMKDPLALMSLSDWLNDHGFAGLLERFTITPGVQTRIKWPSAWMDLIGRLLPGVKP